MEMSMDDLARKLISIQYSRNDISLERDHFRIRGDVFDIMPASGKNAIRVEFFGDEIDRIMEINTVTGEVVAALTYAAIYPASHYATSDEKKEAAIREIEAEMLDRVAEFQADGKLIEAQRIAERTKYDMEMLREVGFCSGIENYSRVLSGRKPGSTPYTLLDYFPEDFLLFVDESHVTLPQVRGMSGGDRARKKNLIDFGFRLPSAFDNRPLFFDEFESKLNQTIYVSATPSEYEKEHATQLVEQIIRPTGLLDPKVEIRPVAGQIDDLMGEIRARAERDERVLVTTLTKKMAEDICEYLEMNLIKVRYIHHNVETMERQELIRDLRLGVYDVLIGINLLREGLDIPEVSLVAILDADKEGFLRSETSLVQTIGRAARNAEGTVIMYADTVTKSMDYAIKETERRRKIQEAYNEKNGIVPTTIKKDVRAVIEITSRDEAAKAEKKGKKMTKADKDALIEKLTKEMKEAAKALDFEHAAYLRDTIAKLKK
jgi:excinuclease ABC subunit B